MTTVRGFVMEITNGNFYTSGKNANDLLDRKAAGYILVKETPRPVYRIDIPTRIGTIKHLFVARLSDTTARRSRGLKGNRLYWKVAPEWQGMK